MRHGVGKERERMMKKLWSLACTTGLLLFSCSPPVVKYSVPPPKLDTFMVLIEQDYDTAWKALIDHLSQSSFAIDNFEKDSGLITLTFSASPDRYVECGDWNVQGSALIPAFQGSYVQWLEKHTSVSLSGKMNVSVYKMAETVTRIRINARYVLTSTYMGGDKPITNTWTFDSGSSASIAVNNPTRGITPTRTCRPTHQAESDILEAVKELSENT